MPPMAGLQRHLGDEVEVDRVERGLKAHPGRGDRRLAAGMTRAYHDHIVFFGEIHFLARNLRPQNF